MTTADRIPTLFDEIVRSSVAPRALGPSIGDDGGSGTPGTAGDSRSAQGLGVCIGDDGNLLPAALGPSIGDDGNLSDRRLKTDVSVIGSTVLGLPLYSFRYVGQDALYEGVMAQDVLEVMPDAVSLAADGFYRVHYGRLGIACRRIG